MYMCRGGFHGERNGEKSTFDNEMEVGLAQWSTGMIVKTMVLDILSDYGIRYLKWARK